MSPKKGTGGSGAGQILGVNLPFRRPRNVLLAALVLVACGHTGAVTHAADQKQANSFLQLEDGQRYWYLEGAVATVAHLIAMRDESKGQCAASWYLRDRVAKRKLIEDTLARYPAEGPTTVVLGLMTQACGELLPAANR